MIHLLFKEENNGEFYIVRHDDKALAIAQRQRDKKRPTTFVRESSPEEFKAYQNASFVTGLPFIPFTQ